MKDILHKNSKLILIILVLEIILSIYSLIYFGYVDRLSYLDAKTINDIALLIQNMYTSTWWALIIISVNLISIFTLVSVIYKKQEYHFISICLWIILFILALDFNNNFKINISTISIFIPIIIINMIAYFNQKSILRK